MKQGLMYFIKGILTAKGPKVRVNWLNIALTSMVLTFYCCKEKSSQNIDISYYDGDSIPNQILRFKEGSLEGSCLYFYPNGRVQSQEFYKDGLKVGVNYYFYEDGNLESIKTYNNGKQEGVSVGYYSSGNRRYLMNYLSGKPSGVAFEYKDTTYLIPIVKLYYNKAGEIIKRE